MPKNKVQFQSSMSLRDFMASYGTHQQCERALERWRWPHGSVCPQCGHSAHCVLKYRRLYQCNSCARQTSVSAGTVFSGSKLPLTVWFLAMYLITQAKNGISSLALSRQLGISQNSAWLIKHKLMQTGARARRRTALGRPYSDRRCLLGRAPPRLQARARHAWQDALCRSGAD